MIKVPTEPPQENDLETGELLANPYVLICKPGSNKVGVAVNSTTLLERCDYLSSPDDFNNEQFAEEHILGKGSLEYTVFSATGNPTEFPIITQEIKYAHLMGFLSDNELRGFPKVYEYFNPPKPIESNEPIPEDDIPF